MDDTRYTDIKTAEDVTDEVMKIVLDVVDGWYQFGRIDWEDVLDRVEGSELEDGSRIDFGDGLNEASTDTSGAIKKIKALVRKHRRSQ